MKKILLTVSFALAIIFAGSAYAQSVDQKSKETTKAAAEKAKQQAPEVSTTPKQMPANPVQLTPEEKAKKAVDRIALKVKDLSPDQVKKLTELHTKAFAQLDKDKAANKENPEKAQEAMKANMQSVNAGVKNILTPEQFAVYTAANQARKDANAPKNTDQKSAPAKETAPAKQEKK